MANINVCEMYSMCISYVFMFCCGLEMGKIIPMPFSYYHARNLYSPFYRFNGNGLKYTSLVTAFT